MPGNNWVIEHNPASDWLEIYEYFTSHVMKTKVS
jgi:hypothetical protein